MVQSPWGHLVRRIWPSNRHLECWLHLCRGCQIHFSILTSCWVLRQYSLQRLVLPTIISFLKWQYRWKWSINQNHSKSRISLKRNNRKWSFKKIFGPFKLMHDFWKWIKQNIWKIIDVNKRNDFSSSKYQWHSKDKCKRMLKVRSFW